MKLDVPECLLFVGPVRLSLSADVLGDISDKGGVYLWCVEAPEDAYRVHYVGEARDIRRRTAEHAGMQRDGKYNAFEPDALRNNLKILVYRAGIGLVKRHQEKDAVDVNRRYWECLRLFYAELPPHYKSTERCYFETAIAHAVEDYGQNILAVARINKPRAVRVPVRVETPNVNIEAFTGTEIFV